MIRTASAVEALSLPSGVARGTIAVPPSKSVAQRVLNLALLSGSPLVIENAPVDNDSLKFAEALLALGWALDVAEGTWRLEPPVRLPRRAVIDCGASGTALRLLVASLSTIPGDWTVTGSKQLAARPVDGLVTALRTAGAHIQTPATGGLPIEICGTAWTAAQLDVNASTSSQYASALLMASSAARGAVRINVEGLVSAPYLDLTAEWMRRFGVQLEGNGVKYRVQPGFDPPARVTLEGDWSCACYPAAACAVSGGEVALAGLDAHSAQADRGFVDLLERIGGLDRSPRGDSMILTGTGRLDAVDIDMKDMPDQVPTLAAIAPFADGTTLIQGVPHLRNKESDRLAVLRRELNRLGAEVEEREDGLSIPGVWSDSAPPDEPAIVDPEEDHRIAMAAAVLAVRRPGVRLHRSEVVEKSYPRFWEDWRSLIAASE